MKVLITSPRGKEKLVGMFKTLGAEVVTSLPADLIIPTVDEELPFFAQNKAWFEAQGTAVMVSNEQTIDACRDKYQFYQFCKRHGFRTPEIFMGDVVAKPRYGKGSRGISFFNRSYVIQERVADFPEVSIDYFGDFNGEPVSVLPRYRKGVVNGESTELEYVMDFDYAEVHRMGKELKLVGHNVIQGFWTGTSMIFTEVNPRFGGGSWMTFDRFNSPYWLLEHSCLSTKKF